MSDEIVVRNTTPDDFAGIVALSREVYSVSGAWKEAQLASHLRIFPEGQFVAAERSSGRVVGASASLIVLWDDYEMIGSWRDFTDGGMFTNHDPWRGRTLYGAEVMVSPSLQGHGIGKQLYAARRELAERLGLSRIRAGSRLRGYHQCADKMSAQEYAIAVIRGEIGDATLTFQLKQGFHVLAVAPQYLRNDPESLGYAAVIEWINPKAARPEDYGHGDPEFLPLRQ